MSESSSSSSSSGRVTKLTAAGKVPAWHFMDFPTEETQPRRKTTTMKIIAVAAVIGILAAVTLNLYHHEEEVLPEVRNYIQQRMTDAKYYITSFFNCKKKYVVEITPEGSNSFFKWKNIKKFNAKIADL